MQHFKLAYQMDTRKQVQELYLDYLVIISDMFAAGMYPLYLRTGSQTSVTGARHDIHLVHGK